MAEWYPRAVRRDGPSYKRGYDGVYVAAKRGEVKHSAEGYWGGLHPVLDDPNRGSWHFTIGYDRVEQHYPRSTICWHAGDADSDDGVAANFSFIGTEHLGIVGEPLTPWQREETAKLTEWLAAQSGKTKFNRFPINQFGAGVWSLAEHNQVSDTWTACPSGRIPWTWLLLRLREDDVAEQDILDAIADLEGVVNGHHFTAMSKERIERFFALAGQLVAEGEPIPANVKAFIRTYVN